MREMLIGFDVLAIPEAARWPMRNEKDREPFFLRPEIAWPISVDRLICPSIFQPAVQQQGEMKMVLRQFPNALEITRTTIGRNIDWPESELNIAGYWTNVSHMLLWLNENRVQPAALRFPVALRIFLDGTAISDPWVQSILLNGIHPPLPNSSWSRLGYDVADGGQVSALSNCSYEAPEMADARRRWQSSVNDSGLLADLDSAVAVRDLSNKRVAEHAPFYIYEVFRIPLLPV